MIVIRLRCDSPQKFMDWAKANSLIEERAADRFGRTLFNAEGFDYHEIGEITKVPAVYNYETHELITPAEVISGHHVDCRFAGPTEDRLTQGKEQTELKAVTYQGREVEMPVLKPTTDRVTLTAVEGVTPVEPATPSHEWC